MSSAPSNLCVCGQCQPQWFLNAWVCPFRYRRQQTQRWLEPDPWARASWNRRNERGEREDAWNERSEREESWRARGLRLPIRVGYLGGSDSEDDDPDFLRALQDSWRAVPLWDSWSGTHTQIRLVGHCVVCFEAKQGGAACSHGAATSLSDHRPATHFVCGECLPMYVESELRSDEQSDRRLMERRAFGHCLKCPCSPMPMDCGGFEDPEFLREALLRSMPNAVQCGRCQYGPIDHAGCDDLDAHHWQWQGSSQIQNQCPKCGCDFSLLASASGATFSAVLDGNAHYYKALASELENFSTYEALVSELEYRPAWMSGGLALHRPAALGSESQLQKSPTYERIVRFLAGFFGVEPIRSLVNHYRSAEDVGCDDSNVFDFTAFHSDQYFSGVNMTIGASFGEERSLVFEHRETKEQFSFPQQNGDVFAFTDSVNRQFVHGIPRERTRAKSVGACRHTPGRISVIVWGRRDQEIWKQRSSVLPITLLPCNVLEYDPTAGSGEEAEAKRRPWGCGSQLCSNTSSYATGCAFIGSASSRPHKRRRSDVMSFLQMPCSQLAVRQQDSLQAIVNKHVQDPALRELNSSQTSTERGVQRWEQAHLVSALDVVNEYQRSRRARLSRRLAGSPEIWKEPRANAACHSLPEEEVRSMCGLCRDILNHPQLFPARNPQSFMKSMADVYDHLQWQLQEVLEKDRSCAELAQRVLSMSRNLITDTITYLLVGPSDLKDTDGLPSMEVVKLWQSLPNEGHPMPHRKDEALQRLMSKAWQSNVGMIIAALLQSPWCVRLFAGADAESSTRLLALEGAPVFQTSTLQNLLQEAQRHFDAGNFKASGLVGALREQGQLERAKWIQAVIITSDLTYLLGEVLVQFHRISDGLGDFGMIRVSTWLHPVLESGDALVEKVQSLRGVLESLNQSLDAAYVLARARNQKVQKPAPSKKMCFRAREAIQRALLAGKGSHADQLLQLADELRARSAPERLPHLAKGLGDATLSLSDVLDSAEFRRHVGESFPELPHLGDSLGVRSAEADSGPVAAPSVLW
eukprot:g3060.t1